MDSTIIEFYNNDNFPCFVENGEDIEDPDLAPNEKEKFRRIARNGLRHLTYGKSLWECKLLTWNNFLALAVKRDERLFIALREETQNIFLNMYARLSSRQLDRVAEKRAEIFLHNLLCIYPFIDPNENDSIIIPQKINNGWHLAHYCVKKIDISPRTGLLAKLIEDEDRLYAYGLEPKTENAHPYGLLEGTTYPAGQGFDLNLLYNFKPTTSVGEGHDTTFLERWIRQHEEVTLTGHSKGGTMAMILASRNPLWISLAECLNPTGLCNGTIKRLKANAAQHQHEKKPRINIYTQVGDPVFLIENGFLEDTHIYRVGKADDTYGKLEAHAHYLLGRKTATISEIRNVAQEIPSLKREFVSDIKEALNWAMFPLLYIKLVHKLLRRKIQRFCDKHALLIHILIFGGTITVCGVLIGSGVAAPLAVPLIAQLGPPLAYSTMAICSVFGSVITSILAPKLTKFTVNATSTVAFAVASIATFGTTLSIGALFSTVKIGAKAAFSAVRSLFCQAPQPEPTETPIVELPSDPPATQPGSTTRSLNSLRRTQSEPCLGSPPLANKEPSLRRWKSEPELSRCGFISNANETANAQSTTSSGHSHESTTGNTGLTFRRRGRRGL